MIFDRTKYPSEPGIYLMKDSQNQVIYVGKATSLRSRLSSYFSGESSLKTRMLVSNIDSIDCVITKNPREALILESNLIKNYQPKYNMVLKDAKHYAYLAVTDEEFPRLLIARKNSAGKFRVKAKEYFGPYVEGTKREISSRYLRKLFKIRICNKLPKRACLQYYIGNCDAPCINGISRGDYQKNVDAMSEVLAGKKEAKNIIEILTHRMSIASKELDYEKAKQLRDQIESLKIFFERQNVEKIKRNDEDYLWLERIGNKLYVQILHSKNGVIEKTEKQNLDINEQIDPEISFCMQYYTKEVIPNKIFSNMGDEQMHMLNDALAQEDTFKTPSKEKQKILEIAKNSLTLGEIDSSVLKLREELELENNPVVIETFDISTLFGENSVASMVQFVNGKANKASYRKFKIKTVEGQDDFSMMNEVVKRRYERLTTEGKTLPDLILIDGGPGQLHAAIDALEELGLRVPIISLAKKEEEIYIPNKMHPLKLRRDNAALKLLQQCRDEAHRFAIAYHRLRRAKAQTGKEN
ncbi:MAG: excinuclease ABC subunit UvrC [Candidatus Micrarchaeota archaeon]